MAPRVLFVSKPIVPPWHDGSKNLVRDIASSLQHHAATVMTTPEAPPFDGVGVASWPIYATSGRFSPALEANARAFAALLRARDYAAWHFVFAPNVLSSTAARLAMIAARVRGVGRVVQTIASRPKRFEGVRNLIFGHVVVALSEWTRGRLLASGVDGRKLVVIPPCVRPMRLPSPEARAALRSELDLGTGPIVLYPGDLEVSTGARTMALAVERIVRSVPEARVVFACRKKTSGGHAKAAEDSLRALLAARSLLDRTRFVGERAELAPLMHEAAVVALPADDLYGKVDVPLVVLEALAAGVPLVLARGGPLETVRSALFVEPDDDAALAAEIISLLRNDSLRRECTEGGSALYHALFRPEVVGARYEEIYAGGVSRLTIPPAQAARAGEPQRSREPVPVREPEPEPAREPEPRVESEEPERVESEEPEPRVESEEREPTLRRIARAPRARASEPALEINAAHISDGPDAIGVLEPVLEVDVRPARRVGREVSPMSTDNGVPPELFRTADEVRSSFLSFFRERGHEVVASAPLIPANDPTLMFTNAGMVQFKDVFTGKETRPYKRATSSQKCIRISGKHNDLENVGVTARHHTFFEMLGNFSFGDYFKEESIVSAWDLLTKEWKLPADRLVISVFGGAAEQGMSPDDEARAIWKKVSGFGDERIVGMGLEDNFWQMGETGPCGPCSEIHFFLGESPDLSLLGQEPDDKGRGWMEIWNLVFMQFERSADGNGGYRLENLPAPCVDTGSGLERVASIVQGKITNYDSDLLRALVDKASDISGKRYRGTLADDDVSMRVIADHARTAAFLIAEGVFPDRAGREYVLRRVMRRAIRHGHRLGIRAPFLHEVALEVVRLMGKQYPELEARKDLIASVAEQEEVRFRSTIDRGLKILEDEIVTLKAGSGTRISGDTAFKLYDTFGFPLDLTEVIAKERDLEVDNAGYETKLAEQRARSEGSKVGEAAVDDVWRRALELVPGGSVKFVGYEREKVVGSLLAIVKGGAVVENASSGDEVHLVTDVTPFYGESGGQVGDRGTIVATSGARMVVLDVQKPVNGLFVHHARVAEGTLTTGEAVTLEVDHELRNATRRNHSATHLLHYALRKVLGEQSTQKGSMVGPDRLRFDFSHGKPLTPEELTRIEDLVNDKILTDAPVHTEVLPIAEAKAKGAVAIFEEKYGDVVRVLTMTTDSVELCGGTHARALGEIGMFKILSDSGVAAGVRRIEGTTGKNALAYVRKLEATLRSAAQELRTAPDALPERIGKLVEHGRELERELADLRRKIALGGGGGSNGGAGGGIEEMLGRARNIPGGKALSLRVDAPDASTLREIAEKLRDKLGDAVVLVGAVQGPKAALVLTVSKTLLDRYKAGELIKRVAEVVGGSGGGRPDMAQAGGTKPDKLDDALAQFWTLVG